MKPFRLRTISVALTHRSAVDLCHNYIRKLAHPTTRSGCFTKRVRNQQPLLVCSEYHHSYCYHRHHIVRGSSTGSTASSNNSTLTTTITSTDGVVGIPIDFDIAATIEGNESQIVIVQLRKGQVLRAESGAMMYMTDGIQMNTTTGGSLSSGFQRMLTGQNFFISDYTYEGNQEYGTVALGTDFPSKIIRLNVSDYRKLICQKGALLCASHTIDIQMEYSKNFTTGFFGGEGFILQGLTGDGEVFLKAGGTIIKRDLERNEQLRISSGCLVAFTTGIDYDVQVVKGFSNVIAGGEGLFMTTLTSTENGTVWLQGQPPQRMISEIVRRVPSGGGPGIIIPVGGSGGGSSSSGTSG